MLILYTQGNTFKMEKNISKKLSETINSMRQKFEKDCVLKEFEKSSEEFEKMVDKGLLEKRGNNSFSLLDLTTTNKISFNQPN